MPKLGNQVASCPNNQPAASSNSPAASSTEQESCKPLTIRASLFFDGTLNDMKNVDTGRAQRAKGNSTEGSYDNDYSNVARLSLNWSDNTSGADIVLSNYVEGAGADTGGSDSTKGKAFGTGDYGVTDKANAGIDDMIAKLLKILKKNQQGIKELDITIDVFGFSRGAAGARYAIHRIVKDQVLHHRLAPEYTVTKVKVLFAGLYDTVASYGVKHKNDTEELNLDAVANAEQVLHLCAAEEHRENFRLTNINSAAHGREVYLPGVHSDVGGSYRDGVGDNILLFFGSSKAQAEQDRDWMITAGCYKKDELTLKAIAVGRGIYTYKLTGKRQSIGNGYSFIALHIMARYAEKTGIEFLPGLKTKHIIPTDLTALAAELNGYVDAGSSTPDDWLNRHDAEMKRIRHRYFHFSANLTGIGLDPQRINGQRERIIQNG